MTTITITAGGKPGAYRGEEGVFAATLIAHELVGPFDAKQPKFPGEQYKLHEWTFAIEDANPDEALVWFTSGESTNPKSKTFAVLTALVAGKPILVGTTLDIETHLVGRQVLVDVRKNENGYLDAAGVTPLPKAMQKAKAETPAPIVEATDRALPF